MYLILSFQTSIVTAVSTLPLVALTLAHKHYNRVARICISSIIVLPSYFASIAFFFLAAHTAYLSPRYRNVLDGSCSAVKTGTPATCIHQWKRLAYLEITLVVFTTVAASVCLLDVGSRTHSCSSLLALVELVVAIIHQTRLKRQCTQTDVLLSSLPHEHKQYDFLNG